MIVPASRPRQSGLVTLPRVLAALLCLVTPSLAAPPPPAQAAGTTYYVSSTGNDANAGTSPTAAWRTLAKVNASTFGPGTSIAFAGGQTFTGCLSFSPANVPGSSATNPFTLTSYGTGQSTIRSNCSGTLSAAITADGVNGFTIDNLKLLNGGSTSAGVLLQNNQSASVPTRNLTIQGSSITGFAQLDPASSFGAQIMVLGWTTNNTYGPLDDVKIRDNRLSGASKTSNAGPGIYGWGGGQNITNVVVERNIVWNLGMRPRIDGAGITANGWDGAVIQHNRVHDIGANVTSCGGASGIMAYTSKNVAIRHNEVYAVEPVPSLAAGGCDFDGIDLDGGVQNSVVEYNYTHDNAGNGLLAFTSTAAGLKWGPNVFRFNISQNDDYLRAQGALMSVVPVAPPNALSIYNNTFYTNRDQSGKDTASACFSFGHTGGTWGAGSQIRNNICQLDNRDRYGRAGAFHYNPYGHSGMTISNNLYSSQRSSMWHWGGTVHKTFAEWVASGRETGAVSGNPLFAAPGQGGNCVPVPIGTGPQPCPSAYRLQSGSPALGAGVAVANSGGVDYYQDPLPARPNIGADAG